MLLVKPLLLKKVHKPRPNVKSGGHAGHSHRENDMLDEEFDEGSPLLPKPSGAITINLVPPFCGGLCGEQGKPGGDPHAGHDGHVGSIECILYDQYFTNLFQIVFIW